MCEQYLADIKASSLRIEALLQQLLTAIKDS